MPLLSTFPHPSSLSLCFMGLSTRLLLFLLLLLLYHGHVVESTTFTFINKCGDTVWPGILSNSGSAALSSTGFSLPSSTSRSFQAPAGWSGRFWARTGCSLDSSSDHFSCLTGDCGTSQVECSGSGAAPPATLAEFTLASGSGMDFYDVSLVDGYNLPVTVEPGSAECASTGCASNLNLMCPPELRVGEGVGRACRSACEAFGKPEFCCSGAHGTPATCGPSAYSAVFKSACPKSYSYAYDDATSTFTCAGGGDYTITFCPGSSTSKESLSDPSSTTPTQVTQPTPSSIPSAQEATGGVMLEADMSWLASMATGDASSSPPRRGHLLQQAASFLFVAIVCVLLNFLIL
ncbi:putative thaumatin-like protein 1 [Iris pallida]|uniref:Thaumatin-like protein 1 n=1 Tax=Iris pallida TaxID=29817 RepID=A0AAX6HZ88_IRIPA|nr:putative thaumatin-like protein 1 [Iris pallida]